MADQVFSVKCGFWDAQDNDRTYSADDMNRPYKRLVADGVFASPDGTPSDDLQVVAGGTSMSVTVLRGQGIFGAKWYENPAALVITVPGNTSIYSRIDSVIVQVDARVSGRVGNIVYRTGTPAQSPVPPATGGVAGVTEYRVADITVAPSAAAIVQSAVTDLRGSASCPWVTALIEQVDTSTLWAQFNAAYAEQFSRYSADYLAYIAQQRQAWEDWLKTLTDELTVSTNCVSFQSVYNVPSTVSGVPIGIAAYEAETDVLQVYLDGEHLADGVDYTLGAGGQSIDLASPVTAGQVVVFVVFKSVVGADIASAVTLVQRLDGKVDGFMGDSGWAPLALASGVETFDEGSVPELRVVGGRLYLRGSVKGIAAANTRIGELPPGIRPDQDIMYTASAVETDGTVKPVVIVVRSLFGHVVLWKGDVETTDRIIITQTLLVGAAAGTAAMVYRYRGTVSSYSDLPETGLYAGDVYMVETADAAHGIGAGDSVMWDGAGWELVSMAISSAAIDAIIAGIS